MSLNAFSILLSVLAIVSLHKVAGVTVCRCDDFACIETAAKEGFKNIVKEDPCLDRIEGEESGLIFNLTNICFNEFTKCDIGRVSTDFQTRMSFTVDCPRILAVGDYVHDGTLFGWTPIVGDGKFSIDCTDYRVTVNTDLKRVTNGEGVEVFEMVEDDVDMSSKLQVYNYENLYKGQPDAQRKSEKVHQLANSMWKYVEWKMQHHIIQPLVEIMLKKANKYISDIPAEGICTK